MLGPFQYAFFKITLGLVGLFLIPDGIYDTADVSQEEGAAKSKTHLVSLSFKRNSRRQQPLLPGDCGKIQVQGLWWEGGDWSRPRLWGLFN